jgi:hypothetical protein
MIKQFKELDECKGFYVCTDGNVYENKIIPVHTQITPGGRRRIDIHNDKEQSCYMNVCTLVAKYFLRKQPDKIHVVHKDGDMWNDNVSNLNYSYQPEYSNEAMKNRREVYSLKTGKNHWKSRPFTINGKKFFTLKEASEELDTPLPTIQKRLENEKMKNYKHV